MPYVIDRARKSGTRFTAMYTDENGRYKSAGTYDTRERAQAVAEQHERNVRLRFAETSPADKATITVRDFGGKFLREHAVEPNSKMTYARLLNTHIYPYIGTRRVAEIGRTPAVIGRPSGRIPPAHGRPRPRGPATSNPSGSSPARTRPGPPVPAATGRARA